MPALWARLQHHHNKRGGSWQWKGLHQVQPNVSRIIHHLKELGGPLLPHPQAKPDFPRKITKGLPIIGSDDRQKEKRQHDLVDRRVFHHVSGTAKCLIKDAIGQHHQIAFIRYPIG